MSWRGVFKYFIAMACLILLAFALGSIRQQYTTHAWEDGRSVPVEISLKDGNTQTLWSGYHFARVQTQALEDNWQENPARKSYVLGEKLWSRGEGETQKSCAQCHNRAAKSMAGVGTNYPLLERRTKKLINLADRINLCRTRHMGVAPWAYETKELTAMTGYVQKQSMGQRVQVNHEAQLRPFFNQGKALYYTRLGQLNLACNHCHENKFGLQYRSEILSQGHSNGFPSFSLAQKKMRSLHDQLQACNQKVRAQPFALGSDEYKALEIYLLWRGRGLLIEPFSVRD